MKPVIALVGRPNVGKSTLFNRLTRSRDALVADFPGLTRDRKYGTCRHEERAFLLVDTGGISGEETGIDAAMAQQSLAAIAEADVVFWLVDGRSGLVAADHYIADRLRRQPKPVFLLVNKTDGIDADVALAEFHVLGFERVCAIAATHGRGVRKLMDDVVALLGLPADAAAEAEASRRLKIGIIGRPNVGKSTLVNRLLGEERVVVFDQPGTTRDSIYIDYQRHGRDYTLIDTAGVRRRKNISEAIEKFSIVKALQAVDDANVVVLVIDAQEGLVEQDLHLLGFAMDAGRALVLAVNKWDGLDAEHKVAVKRELERRLKFLDYAELHFISALHGTGVGHLYESIEQAFEAATRKLSTPRLTRILQGALAEHAPPMVNGRRIKLRYAHAGGSNPPVIVIHGNQVDSVPANYRKFLEKVFRRELELAGTPLRIELRGGENPFSSRGKAPARDAARHARKRAQDAGNRGRKPAAAGSGRKRVAPDTAGSRGGRKPGGGTRGRGRP